MRKTERSGFTLLYALGILVLLSTFALVFARVVGFERQASTQFVDGVRARLAARAGVERAVAELRRIAFKRHYSDPWTDQWGSLALAPVNLPPGDPVDSVTTRWPSFREPDPARLMLGSPLVVSGKLGDTYGNADTLVYKLRVIDCAGQLNVNHSDGPSIQRMLSALLQVELGKPQAQADAAALALITNRPPGGFGSKTDVGSRLVAGGFITTSPIDEWKKLQDDVTVHGWVDGQVIRPWNLNGTAVAALEPLPRSPVNLNTASRGVLTALFSGVSATNKFGTFTIPHTTALALADAIIAKRNDPPMTGTATPFVPFRTWREFEQWVDGTTALVGATWTPPGNRTPVPPGGLIEELIQTAQVAYRDLVKAVCNPNTTNNKFGLLPNHGGYLQQVGRLVDKTDLVAMSTDACFDSMGLYEVGSVGLVLHPHDTYGMIVGAMITEQVVVQVYRPMRLTTQDEFERNRAFMVPGNSIPNLNSGIPAVGMCAPASPNPWPGVVSWPNYSLVRGASPALALASPYSAASWDGYLTLTNVIANKIGDPDFETGFAEGVLPALKVRSWIEPKDEFPTGQERITPPPAPPVGQMAPVLVAPASQPALVAATTPAYASLLDDGNATPNLLFTAGAQLVNTGVIISPDRGQVPGVQTGAPRFLAYDGQNLDLTRGCSIRFWVQPLADPFAHQKEILLSFVGSKDGATRQVGFKVYKEVLAGTVNITLEAAGPDPGGDPTATSPDESGVPVEWCWSTRLGAADNKISIDVTPQGPSYPNDPLLGPEWLPGSWHWVVVNIGPGKLATEFDGPTRYFASLQVDKKKTMQQLFYKGDPLTPGQANSGTPEYGELLGHAVGVTSFFEPLTPGTIGTPRACGWIMPRLLGGNYHCNAGRDVVTIVKVRFFGDPPDPAGPALIWQGGAIPYYPFVDPAGPSPGTYAQGPGWPSVLPFPILSYGHRAALIFYGSAPQVALSLWKTDPAGAWNATFPPSRHVMFGPDADVNNPTFSIPNGAIIPAGTMTGGYPGDAEWRIGLQIMWSEDHYTTGCAFCQQNPTVPAPINHPSIEWDARNPTYFEDGCYSAHNSAMTAKVGQKATTCLPHLFRSWVRVLASAGALPHPGGSFTFPNAAPGFVFPITYLDDDCHGCEACDVDGPVYIGGEPAGTSNGGYPGSVAPIDPSTMAEAVFDNVVFINGDMARRTDWPGANRPNFGGIIDPITGAPVNYADPAKDFEDRFFETNLATTLNSGATGQGAIYHRGLLELGDGVGKLGTMTWTSYETREGLMFEVALWNRPDSSQWTPANTGVINAGSPDYAYSADAGVGTVFALPGQPEGPTVERDPLTSLAPLFVLGVRLQDYGASRGAGNPIPSPLLQSPVFEDVTITVVNDRAVILHAEEGVEE